MYKGISVSCTRNWANATPMRHFDWQAYVDGREEDTTLYGYGETREEALNILGEAIRGHVDDAIFDMRAAGQISAEIAEICFTDIDGLDWLPY
jgi:hypothetical protein